MKPLDQFGLTREQAIDKIIDVRLDMAALDTQYVINIFMYGYTGYVDFSDDELVDELVNLGLVEDAV